MTKMIQDLSRGEGLTDAEMRELADSMTQLTANGHGVNDLNIAMNAIQTAVMILDRQDDGTSWLDDENADHPMQDILKLLIQARHDLEVYDGDKSSR